MVDYNSLSDDFYINLNLSTEMDLSNTRETVLHYFERVQKTYPQMRNFYTREKNDFILEENKDGGNYRWCTIEPRRIGSGYVNPTSIDAAMEQHRLVLDLAPYMLAISPLDCEALDLLFGFDFTYRGNHNQLVHEALGISPALERLVDFPGARVINCEPTITLALDENCRLQCRLNVETRTTAYHLRTGDFPEEQISVYVSTRQYGSLPPGMSFGDALANLQQTCMDLVDNYAAESILQPLARTIAMK